MLGCMQVQELQRRQRRTRKQGKVRVRVGIWKLGRCKEEKGKKKKERETVNWANRQLGERKRQTGKQANGGGTGKSRRRKSLKQESVHKAKKVGTMQLTGNWGKKGKRGESLFSVVATLIG